MPQTKIKSKRGSQFRAPGPPRAEERRMREFLAFMMQEMIERFQNNAIKKLRRIDEEKFEASEVNDAAFMDANFAREFSKSANKVKRKIRSQFTTERLRKITEKIIKQADKSNRNRLYNTIENRIGVDREELIKREGLQSQANARIEEITEWVVKMRDETLEGFHRNTLHAMTEGRNVDEIVEQFRNTTSKRKNHVEYLARSQIQNYNSQMTRLRAQKLGITEAIWQTSEDERVRTCHRKRNDKKFKLAEGLYSSCDGKTLWPGSDHNCRCDYILIIPEEPAEEEAA